MSRPTISLRYIGLGRRSVAGILDLLIIGCAIAALGDYDTGPGFTVAWLGWRFVLAFIVVPASYLVLFEWLFGATPGKFVVGIRVRNEHGERIGFGRSAARNLARLIDALPYVIPYGVGAMAMSRSATHQRLGDRWAGTVVIAWGSETGARTEAEPIGSPPLPPPPTSTLPEW